MEIKVDNLVKEYDFLNMTTVTREQAMHSHFEIVEAELKKILKTDNFDDFYSPNQNN